MGLPTLTSIETLSYSPKPKREFMPVRRSPMATLLVNMAAVDTAERFNVNESGRAEGQPMVFAHGFGCDQHMWRHVAPRFSDKFRVITYDLAGYGDAAPDSFNSERHTDLNAYADDLCEIINALDLRDIVFVGHSVSAMIGVLVANSLPDRFERLVLVGPSPRYINDDDYLGGFSASDVDELLDSLSSNYLGWSAAMAPAIIGNPERPELGEELTAGFCRADPEMARQFAGVTFLSDTRSDLSLVTHPTLVLQCSRDVIAPIAVGEYVAEAIPNSTLVLLDATGHCPNLSAPDATYDAISQWLETRT